MMIEIKPNIFYTGVKDFDLRVFDIVMETKYGTTYNSYVIKGSEKTVLVEIAKENFWDTYIENISEIIDPKEVDYIIVNHTEPDHSGSIKNLLALAPQATVVGSQAAINFLKKIANETFNSMVVKEGDTLSLGDKTLEFFMVPLLHWPDTMYTYVKEDKLLFSCDSFGAHYAGEEIFNDELAQNDDFLDAYKYYYDMIMSPFAANVRQALNKIKDLPIDMIATGHGPIIRKEIDKFIKLYTKWSKKVPKEDIVVIPYVSAYGYTKNIMQAIADGLESENIKVKAYDLVKLPKEDFEEMIDSFSVAKGVLFGSPTLVGDALPPIYDVINRLNPVVYRGMKVGAFGSFGWSGEAVGNIESLLKQKRFAIPVEGLKIQFRPSEEELKNAKDFGIAFANSL